ncbi:hypothetical protein NL676_012224 [Syzygium grande]|nr:hypothetical protein NL676_012224 [Syzygium grande]
MNNGKVVKIKSSIDDGSSKSGNEQVEINSIHEKFERVCKVQWPPSFVSASATVKEKRLIGSYGVKDH